MDTTILQIPMSKKLKKEAEAAAHEMGFSSLQESVRVILTKLSKKELTVSIENHIHPIQLSEKAQKRYEKMDQDFKTGKNIMTAQNTDDLMSQLNGN
jgi:antitoxin component of RelBE/YafQ-DinJ toxin-antitoxin module